MPWVPELFLAMESEPGTYAGVDISRTYLERILSSFLIWTMPDEGLHESFRSLIDLREYYLEKLAQPLIAPPLRERTNVRIVGEKKRPDLTISE